MEASHSEIFLDLVKFRYWPYMESKANRKSILALSLWRPRTQNFFGLSQISILAVYGV
jgi:hypothetical protein